MSKRVYRGRRCRSQWNIWMIAVPAALVLLAGGWMLWSILRPVPVQSAPMVALHESKPVETDPADPAEASGGADMPAESGDGAEVQEVYDFTQPAPETEAVATAILRTPPLWAIPAPMVF